MLIPSIVLRQLYTRGSLKNTDKGYTFSLKNRLKDGKFLAMNSLEINGDAIPLQQVNIYIGGEHYPAASAGQSGALPFALRDQIDFHVEGEQLDQGKKHEITINCKTEPFGKLKFSVADSIDTQSSNLLKIPRNNADDYGTEAIKNRQEFLRKETKANIHHLTQYSFDPNELKGNIENFTGVAQIPLGIAGPIKINGEHAQGDFLVPLATTEGTLVASYNRGIKVLNLSGGATCTVVGDSMQRAPVFVFENARHGREFVKWINENIDKVREEAEATSSVAKLQYIDAYQSNKFVYVRFNYSTGDAAGQNMVGRATFAACGWVLDNYEGIKHFYLESNFATDKKASQVNIMRTRGKRVTAEVTIKRETLVEIMRVEPEQLNYHSGIATMGAFISGANNNGAHSPNAITAMFMATGQDVANVSESSAGMFYSEITPEGDLYISLTIPSLIIATYGGGTGLATQRECLEIMDCYGRDKVNKLAEIIAGVALAGEISLGAAISSSDWVSSHEQYGRNR